MNGLPYYKAYPRDFIEGTIGMSFELKGAYRLVIDLIYMQGGKLPDDARYISGLLGCSVRKWNSFRSALLEMGKIEAFDGVISNKRARKELESLRKLQEKQSENRAGSNKNKDLQNPRSIHTEPEPDSSSSSAREGVRKPDDLLSDVMAAVGLKSGRIPDYWMPPSATMHVLRWRNDLRLSDDQILAVAHECRKRHADPPGGPKALDRAMQHLAGTMTEQPLTPSKPKGRSNDQFASAMRELEKGLSEGSVRLDTSSRDPFAARSG